MTQEITNNNQRPYWLKITLTVLTAWVSFFLTIGVFLVITLIIQKTFNDLLIEGTSGLILLILAIAISTYVSFKITKWLNRKLEKKNIQTNYLVLVVLIILTLLTIPTPMTYFYF